MINFSRKLNTFSIIAIQSLIIYLIYYKFEFYAKPFKTLNQKLNNGSFCSIEYNFNDDIIELLTTATKLDIKLIIVEPQRLVHYISEEELILFRKRDNSSIFETSFSPNKIILGVFEIHFNSSQSVRHLVFNYKILKHLKLF